MTETQTAAERYARGLNDIEYSVGRATPYCSFEADKPGRRYTRILQVTYGRSVHAFVENATGHVFKAASWSAPAKGVRFQTVEDALEAAGRHPETAFAGGYLYADRIPR